MKPITTVYRVQDAEGRGPWRPGFSMTWTEDHDQEWYSRHPPFSQDFGWKVLLKATKGMTLGCACVSLESLRDWFTPTEYATLQSRGFGAVKMGDAHILGQSKSQCVFERSKPFNEGIEPVELYEGVVR